jgi:hypothetical protein
MTTPDPTAASNSKNEPAIQQNLFIDAPQFLTQDIDRSGKLLE